MFPLLCCLTVSAISTADAWVVEMRVITTKLALAYPLLESPSAYHAYWNSVFMNICGFAYDKVNKMEIDQKLTCWHISKIFCIQFQITVIRVMSQKSKLHRFFFCFHLRINVLL